MHFPSMTYEISCRAAMICPCTVGGLPIYLPSSKQYSIQFAITAGVRGLYQQLVMCIFFLSILSSHFVLFSLISTCHAQGSCSTYRKIVNTLVNYWKKEQSWNRIQFFKTKTNLAQDLVYIKMYL